MKDGDVPSFTEEQLAGFNSQLPHLSEKMQRTIEQDCLLAFQKARDEAERLWKANFDINDATSGVPLSDSLLTMASSVFYPEPRRYSRKQRFTYRAMIEQRRQNPVPDDNFITEHWEVPSVRPSTIVSVTQLLRGLGLPSNVSIAHMDTIALSLCCDFPGCIEGAQGEPFSNWERAVSGIVWFSFC